MLLLPLYREERWTDGKGTRVYDDIDSDNDWGKKSGSLWKLAQLL